MGFLPGGKPIESEIRNRERIARGSAAFYGDVRDRESQPPDVSTDKDVGYKPKPEMWLYPQRKDGTRKEGRYLREVARDRLGRFAIRFNATGFKKRHPKRFNSKNKPRHK